MTSRACAAPMTWSLFRCIGEQTGVTKSRTHNGALPMRSLTVTNVSVIHGHSSHHPRAIEVYRDRLILYGCGDFLNDYEGIAGYQKFREDLVLMYFADIAPAGTLAALEIVPLQIRNFQLVRPSEDDVGWLHRTLDREYRKFGVCRCDEAGGALHILLGSGQSAGIVGFTPQGALHLRSCPPELA